MLRASSKDEGRPVAMLYAGLDLSRKRLDFHLLDGEGATLEVGAAPPDGDGLDGLTERLARYGAPIRAAIESMNGARFVHDRLERAERERARWRLHLVRHRSSLKQRVHAVLLTHGKPCPVSDLFGVRGR